MKKKLKWILPIVAVLLIAAAALIWVFWDALITVPAEETYTFINPDPALAETDTGMQIDGVFDESPYTENTWTYLHNANGGNTVDIAMTSWFGEKGIYFAYEVRENTPIYVNMDRATWMNSCIEMYLVPCNVQSLPSENIFEIDLLPNGYLLFKRPNGAGGWSDVSTTHDKMAFLGATTIGGEVNTESCTGYNLELFIPYDYLACLGVDTQVIKDGYINVNPSHITSYNETGTDGSVDRYWYSFGKQLGGDGWNDVNRYFKFNKNGAMGTVENTFLPGENCTVTGNPTAIPGLETTVTVRADAGYALSSITCNDQEYIRYVDYQEDGSVKLTVRAGNESLTFAAKAEPVSEGDKTLQGTVELQSIYGDTLDGVSASYEDASGEHKLELSESGSFNLGKLPQGNYVIRVKKNGYVKAERKLCLNRDLDVLVKLSYDLFETESGNCWKLENANEGILTKINGTGAILTKESVGDFYAEASFAYSQTLAEEFTGDDYQQQRIGMRVKFDNGKYWHIDLLRQNDGNYCLQFGKILGKDSLFNWDIVHTLTPAQIARYTSEEGIKLGVLRTGRTAYLYLDNHLVGKWDLGAEQANALAQLGFESFVANSQIMQIPYGFDISAPTAVELVDGGSQGATVTLGQSCQIGQNAVLWIEPATAEAGAKLLSVQVNGVEMAQDTEKQSGGYALTIPKNQEKILSVKVIYAKPQPTTAVIDTQDPNANGVSVRLLQDGAVKGTATVSQGKATFANVNTGVYQVQARIYNVWTTLDWVTILGDTLVSAPIKALFETPDNTNYSGNVTFRGTQNKNYSIATNISGDAWFTMKLQLDKTQLDAIAANKGNVRLGYRLFFGGYEGNYEWENEYEITLKYTAEGVWVFEQMNTWISHEIPVQLVQALTGDGLHMALHRDGKTGALTLYCGATQEELYSGRNAWVWDTAAAKQKSSIMRFGVGFWSEKGSNYKATVTNLRYSSSLPKMNQLKQVSATVQLLGHKDGQYTPLPQGTQVLLQADTGNYPMTVDAQGNISGKLRPGTYTVSVQGYLDTEIQIPDTDLQTQLTLNYDLFEIPTGWDTEKHDLSKVNDSTPVIAMTGGTMNVLTRDTFRDVSATLWVREANSLHSAHTQGIWLRFEDGKYMILYQEDEKLLYMDKLWHLETVTGAGGKICDLPEDTQNKWRSEGYGLTLLRKGGYLYVTADGQLYNETALPEQYADDQIQVGFFSYDSAPGAAWEFAISSQVADITATRITANTSVKDGTKLRLLQDGQIKAEGVFTGGAALLQGLEPGLYDAQILVFGCWVKLDALNITDNTAQANVSALFEDPAFTDFDGNISYSGTAHQHCSVATDISGDAWFAMKLQLSKTQLDAIAANKGNVRLGYRLFFGGESGNYLWENEYEITLKYTENGWIMEQMNTWEGWDRKLSQSMVDALTGDGLYLALHRDSQTGVLTMYYGATQEELMALTNSFAYTQAAAKHKENITRFGVGFWSENGSDYQATVTGLCYGTTLEEALNP